MTATTAKSSAWPLLAATAALLAALVLAFLLVDSLRDVATAAFDGDGALVRSRTQALGAAGALVLLALVLAHAVIPYPAEITTAAAGYVYGFGLGLGLMMLSWFLTALLAYELARGPGRQVTRRVIGAKRLAAAERFVARGGATGLIAARFLPLIPFNADLLRGRHHRRRAAALRLDDARRHRAVLRRRDVPRQPAADRQPDRLAPVGARRRAAGAAVPRAPARARAGGLRPPSGASASTLRVRLSAREPSCACGCAASA